MKKLFSLISFLGLVWSNNLLADSDFYGCEKDLGDNTSTYVPIEIDLTRGLMIFREELKVGNKIEKSLYLRKELKIINSNSDYYEARGDWSSSGRSKVHAKLYKSSLDLIFKIDNLNSAHRYKCVKYIKKN